MQQPDVKAFFHDDTNTVSYVVSDPSSKACAVIDSVLDYDAAAGRTATIAADAIVDYIEKQGYSTEWILETHAHADHLSAAPYLKEKLGGRIAIGANIVDVQAVFGKLLNLDDVAYDGSQFDTLFADGDVFSIGQLEVRVMHTPGHTPACSTYLIGDAGFVGDTLFMPDYGTARCDFPGGDAGTLYDSIHKILALPEDTRLFMCHDYKAPGREEYAWETTVRDEREHNVHVGGNAARDEFIEFRDRRDSGLPMPRLILPSIQVNIRAGNMPAAESNGSRYLKIPVDEL